MDFLVAIRAIPHMKKELIDPQLEKAGWYLRDHENGEVLVVVTEGSVEQMCVRQAESERRVNRLSPTLCSGDAPRCPGRARRRTDCPKGVSKHRGIV